MKFPTKIVMALAALPASGIQGAAAEAGNGVGVEHLGVNNTLVRVEGDGRYLMLPVQEAYDDAQVNVLVDGKLEKTIYVRLAKSKVDYSMPLDLSDYKDHDVVLNIITSQNRSTVREAKDDACWNNFRLTDTVDVSNR